MPEQIAGFLAEHGNVAPSDALYAIDFGDDDVRDALGLAALGDIGVSAAGMTRAIHQMCPRASFSFLYHAGRSNSSARYSGR